MNVNLRKTAMAVAVAALVASPAAFAQSVDDPNADADILHNHVVVEDWDITVDDIRNMETNTTERNYTENINVNADVNAAIDADIDLVLDAAAVIRYNDTYDNTVTNNETNTVTNTLDNTETNTITNTLANSETNTVTNTASDTFNNTVNNTENYTLDVDQDYSVNESRTYAEDIRVTGALSENYLVDQRLTSSENYVVDQRMSTNEVYENVDVDSDIRREQNEHGRSVYLSKDLSVSSDIAFTGAPEITGSIDLDSAAIAVVDGRQTTVGNEGNNDTLENIAAIGDDAGGGASGNLGFNVAAGDNNAQDNAAALSAADASFAFGMADAEIFNNQLGASNVTNNAGVANAAGLSGAAFSGASGNINVNAASGNNNAQRNSLAASVATSAYAQASVASDQVSTGNVTNNAGTMTEVQDTLTLTIGGTLTGTDGSAGSYAGRGAAYQMGNIYPEVWGADGNDGNHPDSPRLGHLDMDGDMQGSIDNPYRDSDEFGSIGGIAFDTDEAGTIDLSDAEMAAALTGTLDMSYQVAVAATNSATLTGAAFNGASGNIGVNIASGSGNLQSNSLSLAVAQPSTGGTPPVDPGPGG
ncbi:adhesin [Lysobacter sp. GX 14042]|uniref:adhesin n=1 Tax=Lysobacter sp. GX 14042 TaxID=2907155 RepID=UPI001F2F03A5|nr:adhesin [Lysobacter sp. GX 14042]MCE7032332.1 adhesin [Lysobacter sp. GX 14042]